MTTFHYQQLPSMKEVYRGALRLRRPKLTAQLPAHRSEVGGVTTPLARLQSYRALCGIPDDGMLPLLWPQVLATPLGGVLLAQPDMPLPMMGLVHVENTVSQWHPISQSAALDMQCYLAGPFPARKGVHIQITTNAFLDGECVWQSVITALARRKRPDLPDPADIVDPFDGFEDPEREKVRFFAHEGVGRDYARVSGDWNPIHLHPWLARPFGFPRAIATGMWTLATACALHQFPSEPMTLHCRFRRPVFLPAEAIVRSYQRKKATRFDVWTTDGEKPSLRVLAMQGQPAEQPPMFRT